MAAGWEIQGVKLEVVSSKWENEKIVNQTGKNMLLKLGTENEVNSWGEYRSKA